MKNIIILTGPTAVGKTEISIRLAKKIGAEIISADSMQVYKGMDIGTAKITKEEMCGINHYLIDILSPNQAFDVVQFQTLAKDAIKQIYQNGHIPMIVGGTGFYIQSVLYDIDFNKNEQDIISYNKNNDGSIDNHLEYKTTVNEEYRKFLYDIAQNQGNEALHHMLAEVDEESAKKIHYNNVKKIVRALEYYKETGEKISSHNEVQRQKESPYNFAYFVLNDDRQKLYEKIDARVEDMFKNGLIYETKKLIDNGLTRDNISMSGIGYKEMFDYHEGILSLEQTMEQIKQNTRHFAKRQLTWFRREKDVLWINYPEYNYSKEKILKSIIEKLQERNIINNNE